MCAKKSGYRREIKQFQIVLYSPMKDAGFVPETGSEVFVKELPRSLGEYEILRLFQPAGEVFQVRLLMEAEKNENRGMAYVHYTSRKAAEAAVRLLHGKRLQQGSTLQVEISFNNCRIFVGGVPVNKSKDDVWRELARQGIDNIVDVIMYRSYNSRVENRGFVFLEFKTHEEAAYFRSKHAKIQLFGTKLIVDWAIPMPETDDQTMQQVKVIYIRNLEVVESPNALKRVVFQYIDPERIEKIYKFKNYAFIHVATREEAEALMNNLIGHYRNTPVEVTWSKPPSRYTKKEYRLQKLKALSKSGPSRPKSRSESEAASLEFSKRCNIVEPLKEDFSNLIPFKDVKPFYSEADIEKMAEEDPAIKRQVEQLKSLTSQQVAVLAFSGALTAHARGSTASASSCPEAGASDELSSLDVEAILGQLLD